MRWRAPAVAPLPLSGCVVEAFSCSLRPVWRRTIGGRPAWRGPIWPAGGRPTRPTWGSSATWPARSPARAPKSGAAHHARAHSAAGTAAVLAVAGHARGREILMGRRRCVFVFRLSGFIQLGCELRVLGRQLGPRILGSFRWLVLHQVTSQLGVFLGLRLNRVPGRLFGFERLSNLHAQCGLAPCSISP